jgi:UDP-N-acetylmuramoylalanine--D-glutamate ligase
MSMKPSNEFRGKKITMMGLGLLGRGVGDALFLLEKGAELIITDLKTEEELAPSLEKLKGYSNVTYVLGEHRLEDFRNRDLILKAAGVPLDSPFIAEARAYNIPIEMGAALLVKLVPGIIVIGITGTRGKTTTTTLIYDIAKKAFAGKPQSVFLGGNIRGTATLPLVDEVRKGDIVVMELDSWQLQGFGEAKISPHISVFTNFMNDHLNYYKGDLEAYLHDKAQIFLHQKQNDFLITTPGVAHLITAKYFGKLQHSPITAMANDVPQDWKLLVPGEHNRENVALALHVARILGIKDEVTKEVIETFRGVSGRLEFVREYKGIKIYNDTTATTPDATIAALKALGQNRNVVLIMGGADKVLDMSKLVEVLPEYCKEVVLLSGTGSDKLKLPHAHPAASLKEAFDKALELARAGDTIILSPAFASFGMFKNEYDRGDQFMELVKNLND